MTHTDPIGAMQQIIKSQEADLAALRASEVVSGAYARGFEAGQREMRELIAELRRLVAKYGSHSSFEDPRIVTHCNECGREWSDHERGCRIGDALTDQPGARRLAAPGAGDQAGTPAGSVLPSADARASVNPEAASENADSHGSSEGARPRDLSLNADSCESAPSARAGAPESEKCGAPRDAGDFVGGSEP